MVIFLLTALVVFIPVLHVLNERSVQRIALFIGATQVALLAVCGKIDDRLSDFVATKCDQLVSVSCHTLIHKILCLLSV